MFKMRDPCHHSSRRLVRCIQVPARWHRWRSSNQNPALCQDPFETATRASPLAGANRYRSLPEVISAGLSSNRLVTTPRHYCSICKDIVGYAVPHNSRGFVRDLRMGVSYQPATSLCFALSADVSVSISAFIYLYWYPWSCHDGGGSCRIPRPLQTRRSKRDC